MNKRIVIAGVSLIAIGIILGAFGAHALKSLLSVEKISSFETGVRYQMYHGLALLIIGFNADKINKSLTRFFQFILLGIILFSGSIYLLSIQDILGLNLKFLGPITPVGGALIIIGWVNLLLHLIRKKT